VLLVTLIAVVGFSLGGVVSPTATSANKGSTATSATPSVVNTPLAQVTPASNTQTTASSPYTVSPAATTDMNHEMSAYIALNPTSSISTYNQQISNPASPLYRHFLTPAGVASTFGVPDSQYQATVNYFENYGLSVQTSPEQLSLYVSGTVSQMDAAFNTQIGAYNIVYKSDGIYNNLFGANSALNNTIHTITIYANSVPTYLPSGLDVAGISGIGQNLAQDALALPYNVSGGTSYNGTVDEGGGLTGNVGYSNAFQVNTKTGAGNYTWSNPTTSPLLGDIFGNTIGNYQFLFPSSMPTLMGANNLWDGSTTISSEPDLGQGVTIAVIEVGCPIVSDLQTFAQETFNNSAQITSRMTMIAINNAPSGVSDTSYNSCLDAGFSYSWTLETELDIEYAATMAPDAHIDVVAVPTADFTDFFQAYTDIANYLTSGSAVTLPASVGSVVTPSGSSQDVSNAAASISITSNSYGAGELYSLFSGTPVYQILSNETLGVLATQGVTNFFASGDESSIGFGSGGPIQAGMLAQSTGVTSVGGGMVTATSPNGEFPSTGNYVNLFTEYGPINETVAPVSGVASFTYWAEGESLCVNFVYPGDCFPIIGLGFFAGGGFGVSTTQAQPWWQNALDTYSTGAKIVPVVAGSADFNMSVYAFGTWFQFYGGTSFATPIQAGSWALIEEQAIVAFGNQKFGDINPLLYADHNAQEAGVSSIGANAFIPMTDIGTGPEPVACNIVSFIAECIQFYAPSNPYITGLANASAFYPADPNIPSWYATLNNPAGSGWNFLQGLGLPQTDILDQEIIGQVPSTQHALANEPFSVTEVTASGNMPVTSLVGGTSYTFQIIQANGMSGGTFNVEAYNGGMNDGTYGGGTTTSMQVTNGQFTFTPTYAVNTAMPPAAASEYGYFLITVPGSHDWSFQAFAVTPPAATGTLQLGVQTENGLVTSGEAIVQMIGTSDPVIGGGGPSYGGLDTVTLNGMPVQDAVVTETAVQTNFAIGDPTINPTLFSPGSTVGTFLTDSSGMSGFWKNSILQGLEPIGVPQPLPVTASVFTLQASYGGLTSNPVTVVVEPETGNFVNDLSMNSGGTAITGQLQLEAMPWVNTVNVSVGGSPGQYQVTNFPAGTVKTSVINVDLTNLPSGPIVVSVVATGANLYPSFGCGGWAQFLTCGFSDNPTSYTFEWQDPLVFLPATLTSSQTSTTVSGSDIFTFSGTSASQASAVLQLVSAQGTQTLATGFSGTYTLNTATLSDGWYSVVYTESGYGATTTKTITFYTDNVAESLNATISTLQQEVQSQQSTISSLNAQLSSDASTISSLQASLATANANIAELQAQVSALQAQVSSLQGTVATLNTELSSAQSSITSLQSQVNALNATNAADASLISQLKVDLATAQSTISTQQSQLTADQATIASDNQTILTLQNELAQKKAAAPLTTSAQPPITMLEILLIVIAALVIGSVTGYALSRRNKKSSKNVTHDDRSVNNRIPMMDNSEQIETLIKAANLQKTLTSKGDYAQAAMVGVRVDSLIQDMGIDRDLIYKNN